MAVRIVRTIYVWVNDAYHILQRTQGYRTLTLCEIDAGLRTRIHRLSKYEQVRCCETCQLANDEDKINA